MTDKRDAEVLWSREKYRVMAHSQQHYNEIREVLKESPESSRIRELIAEAAAMQPTKGSIINAYQHMWGYFKKRASEKEKVRYSLLLDSFREGYSDEAQLFAYIWQLAVKYEVDYLLKSTILSEGQSPNRESNQ